MKLPFNVRAPALDAASIQATITQALQRAGLGAAAGSTPPAAALQPWAGRFDAHVFSNAAGSRTYKVYVPAGTFDAPPPLVVMLHGCTQSADDFAAGTQMNRLADEQRFVVVYPEQGADSNPSKCWNWFKPQDQLRGAGEPSLIAGIVRTVAAQHGADARRIFVAGLSAGAAMALVLGEAYPDLFAAVGVHSGLPYGSAHDIPSALVAMKGGRSGMPGLKNAASAAGAQHRTVVQAVPVIVFHGDRDHTVQHSNAAHIVQQARDAHGQQTGAARLNTTLSPATSTGLAPGGRRFTRSVDTDAQGQVRIESWTLHGAGHAWSGGHASGTYTDSNGPDASREMLRFFMALSPAGTPAAGQSGQ